MAGAAAVSSVTTNEPHDVSKRSVHVFSGSSRSVGWVAPPSSRGAGASTVAHSPSVVVVVVVAAGAVVSVSGAALSSSPPHPAASRTRTAKVAPSAARIAGG